MPKDVVASLCVFPCAKEPISSITRLNNAGLALSRSLAHWSSLDSGHSHANNLFARSRRRLFCLSPMTNGSLQQLPIARPIR